MADSIEMRLAALTSDHVEQVLDKYVDKWSFNIEWPTLMDNMMSVFDVETHSELGDKFHTLNQTLLSLGNELRKRGLMNDKAEFPTLAKFNNLLERVHYARYMVNHYDQCKRTETQGYDYSMNMDQTMFKFTALVYEDMRPFQKLIYKFFDFFSQHSYRKNDNHVYEQITNPHATHAWVKKCTILELINKECGMIDNLGNWYILTTQKDMDKQLQDYFMRSNDSRFPDLKKNRHVFSFKNGIYFANQTEALGVSTKTDKDELDDLFLEYDSDAFSSLATNVTACKYFDIDFETKPFDELETPILDSIYKYQGLSDDVIEINKMFLGRMLYNVGQLENWQVIHMLLGAGGTGKSTITNIVRNLDRKSVV